MLLTQKEWPGRQGQECLPSTYLRGELRSPDNIFISGEQELLKKINGGGGGRHTEALITLLLLYFVFNVEYPKKCLNLYLFLQRYILKVYDRARLPTKAMAIFERTKLQKLYFFNDSLVILRLKVLKVRTREPHRIQMSL